MKILLKKNMDAVEAFSCLKDEPEAVFFDSAMKHPLQGNYSIIMFRPVARIVFAADQLSYEVTEENINLSRRHYATCRYLEKDLTHNHPIEILKIIEKEWSNCPTHETLPCEFGAMAGYISYDYARYIENLPIIADNDTDTPLFIFGIYDFSIVVDHHDGGVYFCYPDNRNVVEFHEVLILIKERLTMTDSKHFESVRSNFSCTSSQSNFSEKKYMSMVRRAKDYIRDGDIFQVNLSQRFSASYQGDPYQLYLRLRQKCPASFYAYIDFSELQIASASPEKFFEINKDTIITRPIKGTRPSGQTAEETQIMHDILISSEKDRAELMMIVDLLRNDMGKVCTFGTVEVTHLFEVEHYANVLHLVSTIQGKKAPDICVSDVLTALFPGGSITGAPKIRAMEIIEDSEPVRRGVYTGAIGYIGFDGRSDFNIAIRTLVCMNGKLYYHVGGGIVWDSDPKSEYDETLDKGRSISEALNTFARNSRSLL